MDGWKTSLLLGWPIFRGYVSFREGTRIKNANHVSWETPARIRIAKIVRFFPQQKAWKKHLPYVQVLQKSGWNRTTKRTPFKMKNFPPRNGSKHPARGSCRDSWDSYYILFHMLKSGQPMGGFGQPMGGFGQPMGGFGQPMGGFNLSPLKRVSSIPSASPGWIRMATND